ncbi:9837_t:CDS:1, partial [Scutellospora calospora]
RNAKTQSEVGYCYDFGKGTIEDREKALMWYMKSAENRNFLGYNNLGCFYRNVMVKNKRLAFEYWYLIKSAE